MLREMADGLSLDLVDKGLVTDQIVVTIGYDIENLTDPIRRKAYKGEIVTDHYGRQVPKHAHGSENLGRFSSSTHRIMEAAAILFDRIVNPALLIRRMNITANHVIDEADATAKEPVYEQLDLFTDYTAKEETAKEEAARDAKERKMQEAAIALKKKYGKNAILRGMNLQEGATAMSRNDQIGGHKA